MPHSARQLTLTDTGPIVAMINPNDANHYRCWHALEQFPYGGMITPITCLVETLYLLGKAGGTKLQNKLWAMMDAEVLHLKPDTIAECKAAGRLLEKYADIPMDFADAVIVVTADALSTNTVFTLDRHFYAYRRSNGSAFNVVPG